MYIQEENRSTDAVQSMQLLIRDPDINNWV